MKIKLLLSIITIAISINVLKAQNWNEVKQVISPNRDSLGEFGRFVDISENYAIVGASYEKTDTNNLNSIYAAGTAYIYEKNTNGNWVLAQKLIASDRSQGGYFGFSVAITEDYAVVGSPGQNFDAFGNNMIVNAGAAYVFKRMNNGGWVQVQKIVSNDRNFEDGFGVAVDVYGDYIVVGAYKDDYSTTNANYLGNSGSAYLFKRNSNDSWVETQKIVASDRSYGASFGSAVSINGNHVLIGASGDSFDGFGGDSLISSGSAYFFERNSYGSWVETNKVIAVDDREEMAYFGCSVSVIGDKAVVGSWHKGSGALPPPMDSLYMTGAAYVFELSTNSNWFQTEKLIASTRHKWDCFGRTVSISHNTILVSCHGDDFDTTGNSYIQTAGAAYIFKQSNTGNWNQSQKIVASNRQSKDILGYEGLSVFKNNIIAGAPGRDLDTSNANFIDNSGSAYFFQDCSTFSDTVAIICGNYFVWHGKTYYSSCNPIYVYNNAAGCDSTVTLHLTINSKNISVSQDTSVSNFIELTAPSSDHYQWLDCNNGYAIILGDTNQSIYASANGSYAVEIIRGNCIDTSACSPFVNGLEKDGFDGKFKIYPNPTKEKLTIDLGKIYDKIDVRILDLLGRTLNEYSFENSQLINFNIQQTPGIYFVELRVAKEQFVFKIIKE